MLYTRDSKRVQGWKFNDASALGRSSCLCQALHIMNRGMNQKQRAPSERSHCWTRLRGDYIYLAIESVERYWSYYEKQTIHKCVGLREKDSCRTTSFGSLSTLMPDKEGILIIFPSQDKIILWVLKRTVSMRRFEHPEHIESADLHTLAILSLLILA